MEESQLLDAEIYRRDLEATDFGHPLYRPDADVQIGDVGFFRRDSSTQDFVKLFNVLSPARNTINSILGVPSGFRYYQDYARDTLEQRQETWSPRDIVNPEVKRKVKLVEPDDAGYHGAPYRITYELPTQTCAILAFDSPASRHDITDSPFWRDYVATGVPTWYAHARRNGVTEEQMPAGTMVLIGGYDRVKSWRHIVLRSAQSGSRVSFRGFAHVFEGSSCVVAKLQDDYTGSCKFKHQLMGHSASDSRDNDRSYAIFARFYPVSRTDRFRSLFKRTFVPEALTKPEPYRDARTNEDIDNLQMWLDTHPRHLARPQRIQELINLALERDGYLRTLSIENVQFMNPESPDATGSFAIVFKGTWDDLPVAIKQVRATMSLDKNDRVYRRFCKEVATWRQLKHPHVVPLFGVAAPASRAHGSVFMISPWMAQGTLAKFLASHPAALNHTTLMKDVTSGLGYMHSQRLVHGDLHWSNVFIDEFSRALLGDFGLTSVIDPIDTTVTTSSVNKHGPIRWLAPELLHLEAGPPPRKTAEGDMFAFGRVCLCVYTRVQPYGGIPDLGVLTQVVSHRHPPMPTDQECFGAHMPIRLWNFILQCWHKDPKERPNVVQAEEILSRLRMNGAQVCHSGATQ